MIDLTKIPKKEKAKLLAKKIKHLFPATPEGMLYFAIVERALMDAVAGSTKIEKAAQPEARRYIKNDLIHADICGVEPSYIQKLIKQIGLSELLT